MMTFWLRTIKTAKLAWLSMLGIAAELALVAFLMLAGLGVSVLWWRLFR
jgi:hypothetical protein